MEGKGYRRNYKWNWDPDTGKFKGGVAPSDVEVEYATRRLDDVITPGRKQRSHDHNWVLSRRVEKKKNQTVPSDSLCLGPSPSSPQGIIFLAIHSIYRLEQILTSIFRPNLFQLFPPLVFSAYIARHCRNSNE